MEIGSHIPIQTLEAVKQSTKTRMSVAAVRMGTGSSPHQLRGLSDFPETPDDAGCIACFMFNV
jgi:hypothetical protein